MRLLPLLLLALSAQTAPAAEPPAPSPLAGEGRDERSESGVRAWPLWDGSESVEQYAKRVNLEPTKTLDLGNGVKLEMVLIPAGKFTMGTPEPETVDEVPLVTQIWIGQFAVAASFGVLLVFITVIVARAVRRRQRAQYSLARFVAIIVVIGLGVLGGMHWRESARALAEAQAEYQAALAWYKEADDNEKPAHEVALPRPFYLSRYEVTQEQYAHVTNSNPSIRQRRDRPVEMVSWNDAHEFCEKVVRMTTVDRGPATQTVRLSTEAEWEHACRAGTRTSFYSGDTKADLDRAAWYYRNIDDGTQPVGRKVPNAWGLYDMHGNVYEWCANWYEDYDAGAVTDPQGPSQGESRVLRGGSWGCELEECRSAVRLSADPKLRNVDIGFRVAADVPSKMP